MKRKPRLKASLDRLIAVVARLRAPGGCPWDRKQTHRSLIKYLREEARELEVALRKGDGDEIEDELGDVLLQVLLHAQIASEHGRFDIQDVARSQYLKLRRRHPHVFGKRRLRTAEDVLRNWDTIKQAERELRRRDLARRSRKRGALTCAALTAWLCASGRARAASDQPRRLTPHIALLNHDGSFAAALPGVASGFDGNVTALEAQPDGRVIVLGEFTSFNGRSGLNGLARLEADGSLDKRFSKLASKPLSELGRYDAAAVQPDGRILLGGFFTSYGGHEANGLVRLHPNGGMNVEFIRNANRLTIADTGIRVRSIAFSASRRILVGGDFSHRPAIMRLYPDGTLDTDFHAPLDLIRFTGSHNDDDVRVALDAKGRILLAGSLQVGDEDTVGRVVRLHASGLLDKGFFQVVLKGNDRSIQALEVLPNGNILVAGSFNEVEGSPAPNLARLDKDGEADGPFLYALGEGFGKGPERRARALLLEKGGGVIVGGDFGIGRLLPDGRVDEAFSKRFGAGLDGPVLTLAWTRDGRILAGGAFSSVSDPKTAFPAWNKCSSDSQCRVVAGLCGDWEVVAEPFADELEAFNNHKRPGANCVYQETPRPEPACLSGACAPKP